jgi:hypothetical protein
MSEKPSPDTIYPCVGICLLDETEACCIGCGRPWGVPVELPQRDRSGDSPPCNVQEPPPRQ